MVELLETRFFALLAGESFEEITKEGLENELGKFVEEVAGLCDLGDDYLSTCRALNYTKTRLQVLLEMYKDCDGVGKKKRRVGYALSGEDYKWLRTDGGFFTRRWIIRRGS